MHIGEVFRGFEKRAAKCEYHGEFEQMHFAGHWSRCPKCVDLHVDASLEPYRKKMAEQQIAANISAARIPARYLGAQISHCEHAEELTHFVDGVQRRMPGGLALLGNVGTGKTYAACAVGITLATRGVRVAYRTVLGYLRLIRESWDIDEISERSVFEAAAGARLLILDDVGVGVLSEKDAGKIHDLIDERYHRAMPTICISNLDTTELKEHLGKRAYDRSIDQSTLITYAGKSRRAPATQGRNAA